MNVPQREVCHIIQEAFGLPSVAWVPLHRGSVNHLFLLPAPERLIIRISKGRSAARVGEEVLLLTRLRQNGFDRVPEFLHAAHNVSAVTLPRNAVASVYKYVDGR